MKPREKIAATAPNISSSSWRNFLPRLLSQPLNSSRRHRHCQSIEDQERLKQSQKKATAHDSALPFYSVFDINKVKRWVRDPP